MERKYGRVDTRPIRNPLLNSNCSFISYVGLLNTSNLIPHTNIKILMSLPTTQNQKVLQKKALVYTHHKQISL